MSQIFVIPIRKSLKVEEVLRDGKKVRDVLLALAQGGVPKAFQHSADGSFVPTWFVVDKDGSAAIILTPWTDEDMKYGMVDALKEHFERAEIVSYVMVSEVWVSKNPDAGQPSQDPERQEALSFLAVDQKGTTYGQILIERDDVGEPVLQEYEEMFSTDDPGREVGGIMASLLPGGTNTITTLEEIKQRVRPN